MNDELRRQLEPGIRAIFNVDGYDVSIGVDREIRVALSLRGELVEQHTFPIPATNKELSSALLRWRDDLRAAK